MTRTRNDNAMKIIFLVAVISIFFFPFYAFPGAAVTDWVRSSLQAQGLDVVSVSECQVLVPDDGVTFELKDTSRLHPGMNRLAVDLFYNGESYVKAFFDVEIAGGDTQRTFSRYVRTTNRSAWTVRKGDKVTLVFIKDGLKIRADGRVLEDARKNDKVTALNLFQNKNVNGVVADRFNIIIEE